MTKKAMIYGVEPEKLGAFIGKLVAEGIDAQGLNNVLWLLRHRQQVQRFLLWIRRN